MKNTKLIAIALATTASIALGVTLANAAETITGVDNASATVLNAFTLSQGREFNLGTVSIVHDALNTGAESRLVITTVAAGTTTATVSPAAPADPVLDDRIVILGASQSGQFTIADAGHSTPIYVTFAPATIECTGGACLAGSPDLTLDTYTGVASTGGGTWVNATGSLTTTAAGTGAVYFGGTLHTDPTDTDPYEEGTYSGNVDITAAY